MNIFIFLLFAPVRHLDLNLSYFMKTSSPRHTFIVYIYIYIYIYLLQSLPINVQHFQHRLTENTSRISYMSDCKSDTQHAKAHQLPF